MILLLKIMCLQLYSKRFNFSMLTNLVVLLTLFFISNVSVSAETFHIVPTANTPCPQEGVPCMTLSQCAITLHENLTPNASLVLLSGNHTLDSNFTITDGVTLSIAANDADGQSVSVFCRNGVSFSFQDVEKILIDSITFYRCTTNIELVDQLLYKQSHFECNSKVKLAYVNHASITNCTFDGNTADYGGSMFVLNSSVEFSVTEFSNNAALYRGGAIHAIQGSTIVITNCSFTNNSIEEGGYYEVEYKGGGAVSISNSTISISNSDFVNNSAIASSNTILGGAVLADLISIVSIKNSTFRENRAIQAGGALAVGRKNEVANNLVDITQTHFINNRASGEEGGGGCIFFHSLTSMDNCTFIGNFAERGESSRGEANGGGVRFVYGTANVSESIFMNNVASTGGSVSGFMNRMTFIGCMFDSNTALEIGSAIACRDCFELKAENCNFANNLAPNPIIGSGTVFFACRRIECGGSIENSSFIGNTVNGTTGGAAVTLINAIASIKGNACFSGNVGGVFTMLNGSLLLNGDIDILNNFQSPFFLIQSTITFSGNVIVDSNEYIAGFSRNSFRTRFEDFLGGTLSLYDSRAFFNGTTVISGNNATTGGAIFALDSMIHVTGELNITDNSASISGGGIYAYQSEIYNMGATNVVGNTAEQDGGGIYAFSSRINLMRGFVCIAGNQARRGGGYHSENSLLHVIKSQPECTLEVSLQLTTTVENFVICQTNKTKWLHFDFVNNFAEEGGAIFVDDFASSTTCDAQYAECFFQVQLSYDYTPLIDTNAIPRVVEQQLFNFRNIHFMNNSASKAGNTLYGGLLDRCDLSLFAEVTIGSPILPLPGDIMDPVLYFENATDAQIEDVSSEPVRVCFCKGNQPDCEYDPPIRTVRRGQIFNINLVAVDHVNHTRNSCIHGLALGEGVTLGRGQAFQTSGMNCTELSYTVNSPVNVDNVEIELYAFGPCNERGISRSILEVQILRCPIGFNGTASSCECDRLLDGYIVNCSIDLQSVLRKNNVWISYAISGEYLISPNCPFDYCRSGIVDVNLNTPNGADAQCAFSRSGILCGRCSNGTNGLSLLLGGSNCGECESNHHLALLIFFAIAGIALVALILVCNLTVAVGTINGLIFSANIISANRALFLHSQYFIVFIAWLNLDFGFETCFYDGMDGYAKTLLQMVFPSYIITLVVLIIIVSEYSSTFAKLISSKKPVATLETLLYLSYTKVLRLIIAGFSRNTIINLSNDTVSEQFVWGVDGNIEYFELKHTILFIVVLLIAVVGLAFTFLLLFWQFLLRFSNWRLLTWLSNPKLNSFIDAYHGPFKIHHRYWPGLLLLVRIPLYVTITVNSNEPFFNLWIISLTVGIILSLLIAGGGIYKKWSLNVLEMWFMLNLLVLAISTTFIKATASNPERDQRILSNTSASIAFVTFVAILIYHGYTFVLPDFPSLNKITHSFLGKFQSLCRKKSKPAETSDSNEASQAQNNRPVRPVTNYSAYRDLLASIIRISDPNEVKIPTNRTRDENEPNRPVAVTNPTALVTQSEFHGVSDSELESSV